MNHQKTSLFLINLFLLYFALHLLIGYFFLDLNYKFLLSTISDHFLEGRILNFGQAGLGTMVLTGSLALLGILTAILYFPNTEKNKYENYLKWILIGSIISIRNSILFSCIKLLAWGTTNTERSIGDLAFISFVISILFIILLFVYLILLKMNNLNIDSSTQKNP